MGAKGGGEGEDSIVGDWAAAADSSDEEREFSICAEEADERP